MIKYLVLMLIFISSNCYAQETADSVKISRGNIVFENDMVESMYKNFPRRILLNDKLLWFMNSEEEGYHLEDYYKLGGDDIILMSQCYGSTGCDRSLLIISANGNYKISKSFGNLHGNPKIKLTDDKLTISFPKYKKSTQIASETFSYSKGKAIYKGKELGFKYVGNYINKSESDAVISPFGDLKWDDSILGVVTKLSKIEGVNTTLFNAWDTGDGTAKFEQVIDNTGPIETLVPNCSFDFKGINTSQEFIDAIKKSYRNYDFLKTYDVINRDGSIKYSSNQMSLEVVASPIYISGIPFKVDISMGYNPGVVLKNNKLVVSDDNSYIYPYTIYKVELSSLSGPGKNGFSNISKIITNKYNKVYCYNERTKNELTGECYDSKYSTLKYTIKEDGAFITYLNNSNIYDDALLYTKNIDDIKKKAVDKLPDMGSGL